MSSTTTANNNNNTSSSSRTNNSSNSNNSNNNSESSSPAALGMAIVNNYVSSSLAALASAAGLRLEGDSPPTAASGLTATMESRRRNLSLSFDELPQSEELPQQNSRGYPEDDSSQLPSGRGTLRPSASATSLQSIAYSARSSAPSEALSTFTSIAPPSDLAAPLPTMPVCFRCPINQEIMTDPVVAADGITYERENIVAYLGSGRCVSPVTNKPMTSRDLVPNTALKQAIMSYKDLHAGAEQLQRDWEAFMSQQGRRASQKLLQKQRQIRALKSALDQSDRRVHALEVSNGVAKLAPSDPSSASVSTDGLTSTTTSNTRTPPSDLSPAATGPIFKAGPAPKVTRSTVDLPLRRRKGACLAFLPSMSMGRAGA